MKQFQKQKLYCYVDETGQDTGSEFFIVVAVVSDKEQNLLRDQLLKAEFSAKVGLRKWHKSQFKRNRQYLQLILEKGIRKGRDLLWPLQKTYSLLFAYA